MSELKLKLLTPDFKMVNVDNKCEDRQLLSSGQDWVRPDYAPFFTTGLELRNAKGQILKLGKDYEFKGYNHEYSKMTGVDIYTFIKLNVSVGSYVDVTYHSLGIHGFPRSLMSDMVEGILHSKNPIDWLTKVIGKPDTFPVYEHHHVITELTGWKNLILDAKIRRDFYKYRTFYHFNDLTVKISDLVTNFNTRVDNSLKLISDHDTDYANPHKVTKTTLGLDIIKNYPLATVEQDSTGKGLTYTTPAGLKAYVDDNKFLPSMYLKPGVIKFNQYSTEEATQIVSIYETKPTLRYAGGYPKNTSFNGINLIANYTDGDGINDCKEIVVNEKGDFTITYKSGDDKECCVNSPDGSVLVYMNHEKRWILEIPELGLSYFIETDMRYDSETLRNTSMVSKNNIIYKLEFIFDDKTEIPSLQISSCDLSAYKNGSVIKFKTIEINHNNTHVKSVPLFKYEVNSYGKVLRWGRKLDTPGSVKTTKALIHCVDSSMSDQRISIKVISPIKVTMGSTVMDTVLESSFYFSYVSNTIEENGESLNELNTSFGNISSVNNVDSDVRDYFNKLCNVVEGGSIYFLNTNKLALVTTDDLIRIITLPYDTKVECMSRPWLTVLNKGNVVKPNVTNLFVKRENKWELVIPVDSHCYIDGQRLTIKKGTVDINWNYILDPQDHYDLYIGKYGNEGVYFIKNKNETPIGSYMLVGEIVVSEIHGITKINLTA